MPFLTQKNKPNSQVITPSSYSTIKPPLAALSDGLLTKMILFDVKIVVAAQKKRFV
jgi:hypothetical protein